MGFRNGAFAKVWDVTPGEKTVKLRISVSRKNKQTGNYEDDFSGFVTCIGTATVQKAYKLNKGDRIKIVDCDVSTKYDAAKKVSYTNFKIFNFDTVDGTGGKTSDTAEHQIEVDSGEVSEDSTEKKLPF